MNSGLIYRDSLGRLAQRFREEGRSGIAEEISRWHHGQREFLARLISPERQRRLENAVEALRGAQHPDALQKAIEDFRSALEDLQTEIAGAVPERTGELQSISEAVQELARRLLEKEVPADRDVLSEFRARNIPKFPPNQRSIPRRERIDPLEFLREHYRDFLAYFGAPRNIMSQADLQEWDPGLLLAVTNRVNYLARKRGEQIEVREVIPRYSDLLTESLEGVARERVLHDERLARALRRREGRK